VAHCWRSWKINVDLLNAKTIVVTFESLGLRDLPVSVWKSRHHVYLLRILYRPSDNLRNFQWRSKYLLYPVIARYLPLQIVVNILRDLYIVLSLLHFQMRFLIVALHVLDYVISVSESIIVLFYVSCGISNLLVQLFIVKLSFLHVFFDRSNFSKYLLIFRFLILTIRCLTSDFLFEL